MAHPDFASRDFDTIKADLLARASRVMPEWTDRDPSDFGMLFIDLWAQAADVLHYYIDRTANEMFLPTAQQRESVLSIARLLDYTPRGRESATGIITLENTTDSAVTIPAYTEFVARHNNETYYLFSRTATTLGAESSGPVHVTEGRIILDEVLASSSDGSSAQRYTLANSSVAESTVRVFVHEGGSPVEYQRVNRLTAATPGQRVFALTTSADGYTEVSFGTALNGTIPPTGVKITANYAISLGARGNLPALTPPNVTFKAAAPIGVSVVSFSGSFGGLNEESIESLKTNIPSAVSAQNRAVTRDDFVAMALQVPGVAKASIDYTPSTGGPSAGNASVTVYPAVPIDDEQYLSGTGTSTSIPAELQQNVIDGIQPKALLGVNVYCADTVEYTLIDVIADVYVSDTSVAVYVKRAVEAAIDELFRFDNVFFGQRLTLAQIHRLILDVPGVDYVTVSRFDQQGGTDVKQSILIDPLKLPKKGLVTITTTGGITTTS